jgi:hypothetical protein
LAKHLSKVTKPETLSYSITNVSSKKDAKLAGSWDFSQTPSKTLKNEIESKAIELGANHIILFEKKNCEDIDMKTYDVQTLEGSHCYRIWYYHSPEKVKEITNQHSVINAIPKATTSKSVYGKSVVAVPTTPKPVTPKTAIPKPTTPKVEAPTANSGGTNGSAIQ